MVYVLTSGSSVGFFVVSGVVECVYLTINQSNPCNAEDLCGLPSVLVTPFDASYASDICEIVPLEPFAHPDSDDAVSLVQLL